MTKQQQQQQQQGTSNSSSGSGSSSTSYSFRNLSVDLGSKHARPALEVLLKMEKRRNRVRSARVFTKNGYIYHSSSDSNNKNSNGDSSAAVTPASAIAEIFDLLSRLPNLKYLTIDFHHFLPLEALCFLSQCPRLRELVIEHVKLTNGSSGNNSEDPDGHDNDIISRFASQGLRKAPSLQELSLLNCRGTTGLEILLQNGLPASSLKKLTIVNTPIGTCNESIEVTMAQLGSNPRLQSLRLLDVPYLQDTHVQTLSHSLRNLTELEFTSNLLGPTAGQTFVQNLPYYTKLEQLKLHLDWEDCGPVIADMLRNPNCNRLKTLDLRLYGDDDNVRDDAIRIALSLQNNSTSSLKRLRLCMEMEPGGEDDEAILQEFETTLQTNHQLRYLELDDSIEAFPLPLTLHSKLRLNRSGAPKLWRRNHHATHQQFVQAIVNQRDDLNTIFHILREEPTLCCLAATAAPASKNQQQTAESDMCCSSSDDDCHHRHRHPIKSPKSPSSSSTTTTTTTVTAASFLRTVTTTLSPKSSKRTRTTKRFLQRKVRSIFATSA